MTRLFLLMYSIVGPSLAGVGVIAALVAGLVAAKPIILAAAAGALIGLPASWLIARQLEG